MTLSDTASFYNDDNDNDYNQGATLIMGWMGLQKN